MRYRSLWCLLEACFPQPLDNRHWQHRDNRGLGLFQVHSLAACESPKFVFSQGRPGLLSNLFGDKGFFLKMPFGGL